MAVCCIEAVERLTVTSDGGNLNEMVAAFAALDPTIQLLKYGSYHRTEPSGDVSLRSLKRIVLRNFNFSAYVGFLWDRGIKLFPGSHPFISCIACVL